MCAGLIYISAIFAFLTHCPAYAVQTGGPYLDWEDKYYTVQKGDYLYKIAKDHDVSFPFLQIVNSIKDPNVIGVGKKLLVSSRVIVPMKLENGILVNLPEYRMYIFDDGKLTDIMPIAIGLKTWRTPTGEFKIKNKIKNPVWYMPKDMANKLSIKREIIPAGPLNPLGDMWIGLDLPHIGIHSTNQPMSIGKPLSHGCMRLYPWHAKKFFGQVEVDTPGEIIYEPVKIVLSDEEVYLEVHEDVYNTHENLVYIINKKIKALGLEKKGRFLQGKSDGSKQAGCTGKYNEGRLN